MRHVSFYLQWQENTRSQYFTESEMQVMTSFAETLKEGSIMSAHIVGLYNHGSGYQAYNSGKKS